jgi:hypothetical protein
LLVDHERGGSRNTKMISEKRNIREKAHNLAGAAHGTMLVFVIWSETRREG